MDPQRNEMEGGAAAYEQESRMEGGAAEEVIPIPKPTECERAVAFVKELQDNIEPIDETKDIYFDFVAWFETDQKQENIGKVRYIYNGIYQGTNLEDTNFLETIDYNDGTELSRLFRQNLNGINSFSDLRLQSDGSINGSYNFSELSPDGSLRRVICDAEKKCTCTFKDFSKKVIEPQPVIRAATKTG